MAQLGAKNVRTVVTALELLSDDGEHVLMIGSTDGVGGGGVRLRVRRPWDNSWGGDFPSWTVSERDARVVAKAVGNEDVSYLRDQVEDISNGSFRRDNPNPPELDAAKLEYEARCTELDIERARAANIQQEFILDHSRDKHITADVVGCPTCEAKVIPSAWVDGTIVEPDADTVEDDENPFRED